MGVEKLGLSCELGQILSKINSMKSNLVAIGEHLIQGWGM